MRFVKTAVGHRVTSNSGRRVTQRLGQCRVVRITEKGYLIVEVTDDDVRRGLSQTDSDIKRALDLPAGPWDSLHSSLAVKLGRGCSIVLGGHPVGSRQDLLPGRCLDQAVVALAGAFAGGYVWSGVELVLGSVLPA